MQSKTFYSPNGFIVGSVKGDLSIVDFSQWDGFDSIEGFAESEKSYVLNGVLTERPQNPAVLNGNIISGIPVPGDLWIDGVKYKITEDTVEISMPSTTRPVLLECFPYLPITFEVST